MKRAYGILPINRIQFVEGSTINDSDILDVASKRNNKDNSSLLKDVCVLNCVKL